MFVVAACALLVGVSGYSQKIPTWQAGDNDGYPGNCAIGNLADFDAQECLDDRYTTHRILAASTVGIIMALIFLFSFLLWGLCRCCAICCKCCRWCCCNCFCGTGGPNPYGYTKRQRSILFVMLVFVSGWIIVCVALGVQGILDVVNGTVMVFDQAMTSVTTMENMNTMLQASLTLLGISSDSTTLTSEITDVKNQVSDLHDNVDNYEGHIKTGSYVFFGFFLFNILIGIFGYLCKRGCFAMTMGVVGFVLVIICWFLFAVFYAGGAFIDDTCVQLQLWYDCRQPGADQTALQCSTKLTLTGAISCPNVTQFSSDYAGVYNKLNTLITDYNANYATNTNYINFANPSGSIQASSFTDYNSNKVYRTSVYTQAGAQSSTCSPSSYTTTNPMDYSTYSSSCMSSCVATDLSNPNTNACYQKAILAATDSLLSFAYIANCEFVTDLANDSTQQSRSCDMLGNGFIYQFGAQGALGILYAFVIFVGIKGFHVWQFWEEDSEEYQEEQAEKEITDATGGVGSAGAALRPETVQTDPDYQGEETSSALRNLQDNYYHEWKHGVSKPGPPIESMFHNMLTESLLEEEREYRAGLPPRADDDYDDDDDDDRGTTMH